MDTKQAIYTMLLSNGYIYGTEGVPTWGSWGSGITPDYELSGEFGRKCQENIDCINWEAMQEPNSANYSKWQGTFSDDAYVDVMYGTIYLHDGSSYAVGCEIETYDFGGLLSSILQYNELSLIEAIDRMARLGQH